MSQRTLEALDPMIGTTAVMAIVATLAFMMLRASNVIDWPWWAVFAPLIGVLALCVIIVVVAFFVAIIGLLIDQIRHP